MLDVLSTCRDTVSNASATSNPELLKTYPDRANFHAVRVESRPDSGNLGRETLARVAGASAGEPASTQ